MRAVDDLWRDLRHAARMLARTPGFTAVAVVSLALGIGANTAIFSVVDALMLRPLAVQQPERLIPLTNSAGNYVRYSMFERLRDAARRPPICRPSSEPIATTSVSAARAGARVRSTVGRCGWRGSAAMTFRRVARPRRWAGRWHRR
jgi:hypothetical protein